MADTQRTTSALLALLADNTSGDISPQDMRDVLVSLAGGYGELYVSSAASAQVVGTTPAIITAWDTAGESDGAVVVPSHANNNFSITISGVYLLNFDVSFSGTNSTTFTMQAYIDSVAHHTKVIRKLSASGDVGTYHTAGLATITSGQVVDLRVNADGESKDFTVQAGQFCIQRVN